jgi:hypothetical protein
MKNDPIKKPVKLLVGHINPDLDVIGAMWLFLRFDERTFREAQMYFVNAGDEIDEETLLAKELKRAEVVHVDTGLGIFDHHQPGHTEHDSASMLVYEYLTEKMPELGENQALERVINFLNETDHFVSYGWPEPANDRYLFMLEEMLAGLRSGKHFNDRELVEFGMICLDGIFTAMKLRVSAEKDIEELGQEFESPWGKALAIENQNDAVIKLAQKMGYEVVVRKEVEGGNVRIKSAPKDTISLESVYQEIRKRDRVGSWFYHPSGHMLLNNSSKGKHETATTLTLEEVVEIVKKSNE